MNKPHNKGAKTFKNEWASKYEETAFRVNVVSGKIPYFIYYDADGTEVNLRRNATGI